MRNVNAGLADLKILRKALEQTRLERERAEREAEQARRERAASTPDVAIFQKAMRNVTPLAPRNQVEHRRPAAPSPNPATATRRARATGEPSDRTDTGVSDGGVTRLLCENGTAYVRAGAAPDTARKLKQGHWRVGAEIDLHGLRVEQARHAVIAFLDECLSQGIGCARVIHGKGHGSRDMLPVLKDKTRAWLVQKPEVMAFSEASAREGGSGALLVLMTPRE